MIEKYNQNIDFDLPEELDLIDVIYAILEKNKIKDTIEQWQKRAERREESQAIIIGNAAVVLVRKIAPDEKVIELLQKYLTISPEIARNIITDIKLKLIPYAVILDEKKSPVQVGVKETTVKNVEQNAKINEVDKKFTEENKNKILENLPPTPPQVIIEKKGPDTYREPIE